MPAYFTRSFYKHILGQPLTYHDMEDLDLDVYNSMKGLVDGTYKPEDVMVNMW